MTVSLRRLDRLAGQGRDRRRRQSGQSGQRGGTRALSIRTGWVRMRMVVRGVMMMRMRRPGAGCPSVTCRVGVTQHDSKTPIHRREHESDRNECPEAQHCEHQRDRPMARTAGSQATRTPPHHALTMPEHRGRRKLPARGMMVAI